MITTLFAGVVSTGAAGLSFTSRHAVSDRPFRRRPTFRMPALLAGLASCLVALSVLLGRAADADSTTSAAARVNHGTDVVAAWKPGQHLYVKGNLGVSQGLLDGLEQWLDKEGTNWVVYLAENASDESYRDSQGSSYTGVEAVNHSLGKGLMNQTTLGLWKHPKTQESSACMFTLFLRERQLFYYGSDAQDRRGLGDDAWKGRLDAPAIAAMRNGGRIVDAVKDTVSSINRLVEQRIQGEEAERVRVAAERAAAERNRAETAKASLETAAASVAALDKALVGFRSGHANAEGDLARPDLPGMRAGLELAKADLERKAYDSAQTHARHVAASADSALRGLQIYADDAPRFPQLRAKLDAIKPHRHFAAAAATAGSAESAYTAALQAYNRGDSAYHTSLEAAEQGASKAQDALLAAARVAELERTARLMAGIISLAGLVIVGLVMSRRRLPLKREAEALLGTWTKGVEEKNDALVGLLDRRETLLGSSKEEVSKRFAGVTKDLGLRAVQDIDELFIMAACAGRVLRDARSEMEPAGFGGRLRNKFLRGPFKRALRLLRDEPVAFHQSESLEIVVRGQRSDRARLLGTLEDYKPFQMTFEQLIQGFNERATRALNALERIAASLGGLDTRIKEASEKLADVARAETAIGEHARTDGLFRVPDLFGKVLPAASQRLADANQLAIGDPVDAFEGPLCSALETAAAAASVAGAVLEWREKSCPALRAAHSELLERGLTPGWIGETLAVVSGLADAAAESAGDGDAAPELEKLKEAWGNLGQRAAIVCGLARERAVDLPAAIERVSQLVAGARREIGASLGLGPEAILREQGADPDDFLKRADAALANAAQPLSLGDGSAAEVLLAGAREAVRLAEDIVVSTRKALEEYPGKLPAVRTETARIRRELPARAALLAGLIAEFSPEVLALGAGDPTHPEANGTVRDNLDEVEAHLVSIETLTARAEELFKKASILRADEALTQAAGQQALAVHRLDEVSEKDSKTRQAAADNVESLRRLDLRLKEAAAKAAEPPTMEPTRAKCGEAGGIVAAARRAVTEPKCNPFAAAELLKNGFAAVERVLDLARCDRDVFNEAQRSADAADGQIRTAQELARRTENDGAGDSREILAARSALTTLESALAVVRSRLVSPHQDWNLLDREADRIANEAAACAATLRGELSRAESAIAAITACSHAVRQASGWTGRFGVAILGNPGSDLLTQARSFVNNGRYDEAKRMADGALRAAMAAITAAEAEVQRRRRAEEEAIEQARRARAIAAAARRAASASSNWGGSNSSWGGSGSMFGGGSGGGGGSSGGSSWGSSGSGFSGGSGFSSGSGFGGSSW